MPYNNHPTDEWTEEVDAVTPKTEVKVSIRDFVVPEKTAAFINAYSPAPDEIDDTNPNVETFDDTRLREFFKAYVCGLGDPLAVYLEALSAYGFRMRVSLATNEPCLFVIDKKIAR